jgi:single-strand DNA-binding protein
MAIGRKENTMSDKKLKMPSINKVEFSGNMTRDGELKYLPSGMAVFEFSVAVTERRKNKKTGEMIEETSFIDCAAWDKAAEWLAKDTKKGSPVIVDGKFKTDTWEDKSTGQKRSKLKVTAFRVQTLAWEDDGGRPGAHSSGGGQQGGGYSEAPKPRVIEEPITFDDIPF